jgi:trk system potassium uptake protein
MRIVFVGAGELTVATADLLTDRGHEVIIIEAQKDKIEDLSETLDCSFLHGDGSRPHILEEADPKHCDVLFCLTDNDQNNIIAGLVGRSLGFKRVVVNIHDREFESICLELGLEDTIIPSRTIGRYLADMASGIDTMELSTVIKGEARLYGVTIDKDHSGRALDELELPEKTKAIFYYRDDQFYLPDKDTKLKQGDELIFICHVESLEVVKEMFNNVTKHERSEET